MSVKLLKLINCIYYIIVQIKIIQRQNYFNKWELNRHYKKVHLLFVFFLYHFKSLA